MSGSLGSGAVEYHEDRPLMEEWLPISGYEDRYAVSSLGRVRSSGWMVVQSNGVERWKAGRILKPSASPTTFGHTRVNLFGTDGSVRTVQVHRLVALAFLGEPQTDGLMVCHNNGDPGDNRVENLRWDTMSGNMYDRRGHGTDHEANKTHCPRGHEYSPANTYMNARGHRWCRECHREANARYRESVKMRRAKITTKEKALLSHKLRQAGFETTERMPQ